jgi:biopolymer transport protein ExbD
MMLGRRFLLICLLAAAAAWPAHAQPMFLTVRADRTLVLNDATVAPVALGPVLDRLSGGDRGQRVFLRADTSVPYGEMMEVMNALRAAGYLKVALVGLDAGQRQ